MHMVMVLQMKVSRMVAQAFCEAKEHFGSELRTQKTSN